MNQKSSKRKPPLRFTDERLIPELNKGAAFFYEHLARYLFASQLVKNKIVLDAGCGTGYGCYILAKNGEANKVYGIDISKETIDHAKSKYGLETISFKVDDVEKLKTITDKRIDLIASFEVIEHIKSQDKFLEQVKRVLKPNGLFIISTPNKYTYPKGNPFHTKELHPDEFYQLLKQYFKNVKFYHQAFELAQLIKEEKREKFNLEETFAVADQELYTTPLNTRTSQFLVAVCSDKTLPSIKTLSITSAKVDNFDLSRGLLSLGEQFNNLQNQLNSLNSQNTQFSQQLQQKTKENENLKTQLNNSSEQINLLIQENQNLKIQLNKTLTLVDIVKKETERKNRKINALENQLKQIGEEKQKRAEELKKENESIQREIEQTKQHIENLESVLTMIKSAKFFKLWQGYCKIMKLVKLKS